MQVNLRCLQDALGGSLGLLLGRIARLIYSPLRCLTYPTPRVQVDLRCFEDALGGDLGCLLGESWFGLGLDACSTDANGVLSEGLGGRAFQELFP